MFQRREYSVDHAATQTTDGNRHVVGTATSNNFVSNSTPISLVALDHLIYGHVPVSIPPSLADASVPDGRYLTSHSSHLDRGSIIREFLWESSEPSNQPEEQFMTHTNTYAHMPYILPPDTHSAAALPRPLYPLESQRQQWQKKWMEMVTVQLPKHHAYVSLRSTLQLQHRSKLSSTLAKEVQRIISRQARCARDHAIRGRRLVREVASFWRRAERDSFENRKKAEKEEFEQRRKQTEQKEAERQKKKLEFLLTQTELYSHFIGKKMGIVEESPTPAVVATVKNEDGSTNTNAQSTQQTDAASSSSLLAHAATVRNETGDLTADEATRKYIQEQRAKMREFDKLDTNKTAAAAAQANETKATAVDANGDTQMDDATAAAVGTNGGDSTMKESTTDELSDLDLLNPSTMPQQESFVQQATSFKGQLKSYQLRGLNWLLNLYEQGINGILADEMGLGKTVQSISFLSYLSESKDCWGPFLIVAPNSTLHQWQQEITKFAPTLKVLPYWGSAKERQILRSFWTSKLLYTKDAPFHVLITSYNVVVQDEKYFHRMKFMYMILDEAQAIKNAASQRWKCLLNLKCRNRVLLTGTPIQNSMAELWALLHFIMPQLFASHEDFHDWFSKDVEDAAAASGGAAGALAPGSGNTLDQRQVHRLHMILKPFMLRRCKCLRNDMEVLLANGMTKRVGEIQKGDMLLGDDGQQRIVTQIHASSSQTNFSTVFPPPKERLHTVTFVEGKNSHLRLHQTRQPFVCTLDHTLVLRIAPDDQVWAGPQNASHSLVPLYRFSLKSWPGHDSMRVICECIGSYSLSDLPGRLSLERSSILAPLIWEITVEDYLAHDDFHSLKSKAKMFTPDQAVEFEPEQVGADGISTTWHLSGWIDAMVGPSSSSLLDDLAWLIGTCIATASTSSNDSFPRPPASITQRAQKVMNTLHQLLPHLTFEQVLSSLLQFCGLSSAHTLSMELIHTRLMRDSPTVRCGMLQGLIDGYGAQRREDGTFDLSFSSARTVLAGQIVSLAKGLGLKAIISQANDSSKLLSLTLSPSHSTSHDLSIHSILQSSHATDDYTIFSVSGNGRFLLADYTIVHNCDVENEMPPKTEITLPCKLSAAQMKIYRALQKKILLSTQVDLSASSNSGGNANGGTGERSGVSNVGRKGTFLEKLATTGLDTPFHESDQVASDSLVTLVMAFRKLCNHPELYARKNVQAPYYFGHKIWYPLVKQKAGAGANLNNTANNKEGEDGGAGGSSGAAPSTSSSAGKEGILLLRCPASTLSSNPISPSWPSLLDRAIKIPSPERIKNHVCNIFVTENIQHSVYGNESGSRSNATFSFLPFLDLSVSEFSFLTGGGAECLSAWFAAIVQAYRMERRLLRAEPTTGGQSKVHLVLPSKFAQFSGELELIDLVEGAGEQRPNRYLLPTFPSRFTFGGTGFVWNDPSKYFHAETLLRRLRRCTRPAVMASPPFPKWSKSVSAPPCQEDGFGSGEHQGWEKSVLLGIDAWKWSSSGYIPLNGPRNKQGYTYPVSFSMSHELLPQGLQTMQRKIFTASPWTEEQAEVIRRANILAKNGGSANDSMNDDRPPSLFVDPTAPLHITSRTFHSSSVSSARVVPGLLSSVIPLGLPSSRMLVPTVEDLIADSGKLQVLDQLLSQLKREGHRVLIFSQMTKLIDLLENFLAYRKYKFARLDGSTSLSERRDLVRKFQHDPTVFAFLLSTRAGGLGINLTSADTVIFYDNDWNPSSDAQAMDRVHRIGQQRPCTIYRLVCVNTVEERILIRAQQKHVIQATVYAGGFKMGTAQDGKSELQELFNPDELKQLLIAEPTGQMGGINTTSLLPSPTPSPSPPAPIAAAVAAVAATAGSLKTAGQKHTLDRESDEKENAAKRQKLQQPTPT